MLQTWGRCSLYAPILSEIGTPRLQSTDDRSKHLHQLASIRLATKSESMLKIIPTSQVIAQALHFRCISASIEQACSPSKFTKLLDTSLETFASKVGIC